MSFGRRVLKILQAIGRRHVVGQLDILNGQENALARSHIARPDTAVTPQVHHESAWEIGHAICFGILGLVVHPPARDSREPVQAVGGPGRPVHGEIRDCARTGDRRIVDGIVVWLVGVVYPVGRVLCEDLNVRFAVEGAIGENADAGTGIRLRLV